MRIAFLALVLVTAGCEAVVHFDRSKIDGGAKALTVQDLDVDAGLVEPPDRLDAGTD